MITQQKQIEEMNLNNKKRNSMSIITLLVLVIVSVMGLLSFWIFKSLTIFLDWLFC
jgi:hypothetical protein